MAVAGGIGPKLRKKLETCGITTLYDVVWHLPVAYEEWSVTGSLDDALAHADMPCVLEVKLQSKRWAYFGGRRRLVASFEEVETGKRLDGTWMFAAHGIEAKLVENATFLMRGKLKARGARPPSAIHPDLRSIGQGTEPRYARSIGPEQFRKLLAWALEHVDLDACDPLPQAMRTGTSRLESILRKAHETSPSSDVHGELSTRLAFVRACARVVDLRSERRQDAVIVGQQDCPLRPIMTPTADQTQALAEIVADLQKGEAMRRVLTGDVGTGKTWVALAAASAVLHAGGQVAYLCPTGLLAAQVYEAATQLGLGAPMLLTGDTKDLKRKREEIAAGEVPFVIGTHALLHLDFARLALVIIDEQHRLGVLQRLALLGKGRSVHLLSVTATPIPRTLAHLLSHRPQDVAMSTLNKRPLLRTLSTVVTLPESSWSEWAIRLEQERAFIVCPRLTQGAGSAMTRMAWLETHAPNLRVGLLHGGLHEREQRNVLDQFRKGDLTTLVATTVVEVGLDVPDATLMLIDEADRFGLAQLHQLRGRVGRGTRPGHAVLFHRASADPSRVAQLKRFAMTTSGLEVAELDLAQRGPGDPRGVAQSGFVNNIYDIRTPVDGVLDAAATDQVTKGLEGVLAHAVARELALIQLEQGA